MKLIKNILIFMFNKLRGKSLGYCVRIFADNMGIAYIKLAQILAMQNINGVFSEEDRKDLLHICDDCTSVPFAQMHDVLVDQWTREQRAVFAHIYTKEIGSASVSQVYKGVLKNGKEVAIKIRRTDIVENIMHDIKVIKTMQKLFGNVFGFNNILGGGHALQFYALWITQEIDFVHEKNNILAYQKFAEDVNGKVDGCVDIVLPKVYEDLCTKDIIVMEYVTHPTISNMDDTPASRDTIIKGVSSYFQLSFWALFNNHTVIFHGDPHAGNIYFDEHGNIGFLDMGLTFALSKKDAATTLDYFLSAFFGRAGHLCAELHPYFKGTRDEWREFKQEVYDYCEYIKNKPVTYYFMDLVLVCMRYEIVPPDFLFGMAKAFVCFNGIDMIYGNDITGSELLTNQTMSFLVKSFGRNVKELGHAIEKGDFKGFRDILYTTKDYAKMLGNMVGIDLDKE